MSCTCNVYTRQDKILKDIYLKNKMLLAIRDYYRLFMRFKIRKWIWRYVLKIQGRKTE